MKRQRSKISSLTFATGDQAPNPTLATSLPPGQRTLKELFSTPPIENRLLARSAPKSSPNGSRLLLLDRVELAACASAAKTPLMDINVFDPHFVEGEPLEAFDAGIEPSMIGLTPEASTTCPPVLVSPTEARDGRRSRLALQKKPRVAGLNTDSDSLGSQSPDPKSKGSEGGGKAVRPSSEPPRLNERRNGGMDSMAPTRLERLDEEPDEKEEERMESQGGAKRRRLTQIVESSSDDEVKLIPNAFQRQTSCKARAFINAINLADSGGEDETESPGHTRSVIACHGHHAACVS